VVHVGGGVVELDVLEDDHRIGIGLRSRPARLNPSAVFEPGC